MGYDRHTVGSFWASFGYAAHGLWWSYQNERNLRVHTVVGAFALAAGLLEHISADHFLLLIVMLVLVISLEIVNTAVEAVTNLAHPDIHPLAGLAKDLAAAAVLWAAFGAAAVGVWVLAGRLPLLPARITAWADVTPQGLAALAAGLTLVTVAAFVRPRHPPEEADGDH